MTPADAPLVLGGHPDKLKQSKGADEEEDDPQDYPGDQGNAEAA